jgi:hypothetical protein
MRYDSGHPSIMPLCSEDLPCDPARLTEMVLALNAEVETLRAAVRTLKDMIFGARRSSPVHRVIWRIRVKTTRVT